MKINIYMKCNSNIIFVIILIIITIIIFIILLIIIYDYNLNVIVDNFFEIKKINFAPTSPLQSTRYKIKLFLSFS
jgi:uncharacterized protein HemY